MHMCCKIIFCLFFTQINRKNDETSIPINQMQKKRQEENVELDLLFLILI